ncbi:MAG: hypothetical protein ACOYXA_06100 [Bacteroidota bacterium]
MEVLSVTYYDSYDYQTFFGPSFGFVQGVLADQANATNRVNGLVTGAMQRVLGTGSMLRTATYYDDKYRVIQTVSEQFERGIERTTNVYDFVGKLLQTQTSREDKSIAWTNLVGAELYQDGAKKIVSTIGWNAAATSVEQLASGQDGWFEFTAERTDKSVIVGFAPPNNDVTWTTIKYAFYLVNGCATCPGTLRVIENGSGSNLLSGTNYFRAGDVFRIERRDGKMYYYQNGALLLQRTMVPDPMVIDIAFYHYGVTVRGLNASFGTTTDELPIARNFKYDHAGRVLKTWHQLGAGEPVLLSSNEYNELGQLVDKKLYNTDPAETPDGSRQFMQSVDYRYNIRGWLTHINNSQLIDGVTNDDADATYGDLFGMQLAYNEDLGTGNAHSEPSLDLRQYNGNISAIAWKNFGNTQQKAYNATGRGNQHAIIHGKNKGKMVEIGARTQGQRPTPNPRNEQIAKTYAKEESTPDPVTPTPEPQQDPTPTLPEPTPEPVPDPTVTFRKQIIERGEKVNYSERIQFDLKTDRFSDDKVVKSQLGDLVKLLMAHTGVSVYIAGNSFAPDGITGNGPDALNQPSSLNGTKTTLGSLMSARARAVYNFLVGQGVNPKQLIYGTGNVMSGKGGLSVSFEIRNK